MAVKVQLLRMEGAIEDFHPSLEFPVAILVVS